MGIKVNVHSVNKTTARLENAFYEHALPSVSEQMMDDCNHYVRMQSGELADSVKKENNGREITWNTSYAKKVYYTGTPRTNVNPSASLRWCEKASRNKKSEWAAEASAILKG